ncbi:hypothetical protein K2Z84_28805 [Candidatus Binatia bacterium]|nr:hypothetical protein [Candidatus Binatia bacterium]
MNPTCARSTARAAAPGRPLVLLPLVCALALVTGCGGGGGGGSAEPAPIDVDTPNAERCEILDPDECLLPFPSDALTRADAATGTGRRIAFVRESMPANASGVHVDPSEWNRNDGFSPGAQITLLIPGLDLAASKLPPVTDVARALDEDSGLVLLDADTGERVIAWAELDAHAADTPQRQALEIHPAIALREGHRHVVALRGLVDGNGTAIAPSQVFQVLRDRVKTTNPAIEGRRDAMERVFSDLDAAGVAREDLYLAWDFTVASTRSLSERLLHIRDDGFAQLGDAAPSFSVTSTSEGGTARIVSGTLDVPRYLTGEGEPGSVLNDDRQDGLPQRNGTQQANFVCTMPLQATPENPARASLYGHGLLGTAAQVVGIGQAAALVNVAFCATDYIGMSAGDVPFIAGMLGDLSRFGALPDRLQQSHLNFLFLGRAMIDPRGFGSHPAFQVDGRSALGGDLFLVGASQGGILGGATTAIAQDFTRSVLAVGAANYSLLIPRSVDFDEFTPLLAAAYPDPFTRRLGFGLIQMLWDRGEANGYLQHLSSDPYPNTPVHASMYLMAFGDHQVANVGTEVASRTIGAHVRQPALRTGRATAIDPFYGLEPVPSYPFPGSALVVWDFGTPPPPDENLPPREGDDPHGKAGDVPTVLLMVSEYLKDDGGLVDVCSGSPCVTLDD